MSSLADTLHRLEVKIPDGQGGTTTQVIKLDYAENISGKPLVFATRFEFPNTGKDYILYIATDEEQVYRYDVSTGTYKIVGSNWRDIDLIDGGGAA